MYIKDLILKIVYNRYKFKHFIDIIIYNLYEKIKQRIYR